MEQERRRKGRRKEMKKGVCSAARYDATAIGSIRYGNGSTRFFAELRFLAPYSFQHYNLITTPLARGTWCSGSTPTLHIRSYKCNSSCVLNYGNKVTYEALPAQERARKTEPHRKREATGSESNRFAPKQLQFQAI